MCVFGDTPSIPDPPPVTPPPQAAKVPDQDVFKQRNKDQARQAAAGAASTSTVLTGPMGVPADQLSVGKNTVLGA